jgi:HK97 family phage portal protein
MNFFGFDIKITKARETSGTAQKSYPVTPEEWVQGKDLDYNPGSGPVLTNAYEQVVWVYRAINVLAEQIANIPFVFSVGERGRENLITSGPVVDFYNGPHPHLNRFQYWELRVLWLMLRGECFRIPLYGEAGGGTPALAGRSLQKVLILDPARFQHIVENHELIGWRYTGFGPYAPLETQVFLPEEVWFERLPNPFDFWRGLAPLQVAAMAARTDLAAAAFMQGVIENNADSGVIVRTEKQIAPEQQEQVIAALRGRKRRAGEADRPVFLNGVTEIVKPELSSSDLQFLENRKFTRGEICAAFGVPEEIITATEHAKYDVMQGARLNFIENRIAPLCARLEASEDLTVKLLDPRASGWFDLDSLPIMQQARRDRLTAARTGFDLGIPFNELNRVLDLGFKRLPWGDRGYVPKTMQEAGAPAEPGGAAVQSSEFNVQDSRLPAPLTAKLRRFFFEQRQRALAKLAPARPATPPGQTSPTSPTSPTVLLDQAEEAGLLKKALSGATEQEHRRWEALNHETLAGLHQTLREAQAARETPDQTAAHIRALYNHLTRRVAQVAAAPTGDEQPASALPPREAQA